MELTRWVKSSRTWVKIPCNLRVGVGVAGRSRGLHASQDNRIMEKDRLGEPASNTKAASHWDRHSSLTSYLFFVPFNFFVLRHDLTMAPWLAWNSLCRIGWLWTYRDPPVSGSLRLKNCCLLVFNSEDTVQASPSSLTKAESKKEAGQGSQSLHGLPADKEPWPNHAPQGLPYISGLMGEFTKRMKFFRTGNYCWNTTFSRVKCKWIRNTWLKFPSKLNSYGLWYEGENCVFPNMAWVLKTSKCWENGVGTQLTFNYDHNHSSITWQNVIQ